MNRAKPTTPIDKDYTYCYNVDSKAKEELIMKNFTIIDWNIEEMTGYKPMTTFYRDFSIADKVGLFPIEDSFNYIMRDIKSMNYKYITELCMVLNWKIWEHYEKKDEPKARLYDKLWRKMCDYIYNNFNEEELIYYYRTTD